MTWLGLRRGLRRTLFRLGHSSGLKTRGIFFSYAGRVLGVVMVGVDLPGHVLTIYWVIFFSIANYIRQDLGSYFFTKRITKALRKTCNSYPLWYFYFCQGKIRYRYWNRVKFLLLITWKCPQRNHVFYFLFIDTVVWIVF